MTSRIYYDATLMVRYGMETPVGIIRTEHYVAEFLARDESVVLDFVVFDSALGAYRVVTAAERGLLRRILFRRYSLARNVAIESSDPEGVDFPAELPVAEAVVDGAETEQTESGSAGLAFRGPAETGPVADDRIPGSHLKVFRRRFRTALRISRGEFNDILVRDAVRLIPVTSEQSALGRLGRRTVRRWLLRTARGGHAIVRTAATATSNAAGFGRRAARPDPDWRPVHEMEPVRIAPVESIPVVAPAPRPSHPPGAASFRAGDVLISMANTWDYLDYGYLDQLCLRVGVKFVAVIYDVIAMEHPFTTPGPPHFYHRHWVELGHSAAALIAISKHSMARYQRYIAEPNDLAPPIRYAYLPNFLRERAAEIGEEPVPDLADHPFVVFCSTIETRKNHQLLLHLWDRLRQEIDPKRLPTLVFVGKWGWGTETVRLLAERNWRLRPHLRIMDRVSDAELIWMYRHARFTVFPAFAEGFGLAAAESLSFGTPVVVANCPALVEATEGLMPAYDPLDFPGWLAELRSLIIDDDRLDALRHVVSGYRGPDYAMFGNVVRDSVLALAGSGRKGNGPCQAA